MLSGINTNAKVHIGQIKMPDETIRFSVLTCSTQNMRYSVSRFSIWLFLSSGNLQRFYWYISGKWDENKMNIENIYEGALPYQVQVLERYGLNMCCADGMQCVYIDVSLFDASSGLLCQTDTLKIFLKPFRAKPGLRIWWRLCSPCHGLISSTESWLHWGLRPGSIWPHTRFFGSRASRRNFWRSKMKFIVPWRSVRRDAIAQEKRTRAQLHATFRTAVRKEAGFQKISLNCSEWLEIEAGMLDSHLRIPLNASADKDSAKALSPKTGF